MPRRVTLTDRQKDALLRLPTSQTDLLKHYTLSDEDLGHIRLRRRGHCCKVSDEAAFCLIQRPYISKTLLTRRISPRGSP
ncbi:DUF4158 domain-containing protein [Escherichia coli]|nr:DUF4158 domain-containing protein [Escherichia coli]